MAEHLKEPKMFETVKNLMQRVMAKQTVPLTPEEVRIVGKEFRYGRIWRCSGRDCKAELKIKAKANRANGPSNFVPYPVGHKLAGHSQVPTMDLTWNGLAEERGWLTNPVVCPACRHGLTVLEFKQAKREGRL